MAGVAAGGELGAGRLVTGGMSSARAAASDSDEYNIAAMMLLALETVTRAGSLALADDRGVTHATIGNPSRTHSVRLPQELVDFVTSSGCRLDDVDTFVVVTGPGSFTGLRIGLATVQGLALATNRLVIGVPTLETIASGWLDAHPGRAERLVVSFDGARDDVFFAVYDVSAAQSFDEARVVIAPRVASIGIAAGEIRDATAGRHAAVAGLVRDQFQDVLRGAAPEADADFHPLNLAASAVRLAARRAASAASPHAVQPVYLRRPDAVLARERQAQAPRVFEVEASEDVAEVASLQARSFANAWGAEAIGADLANRSVARLYGLRLADGRLVGYCAAWKIVDELHINSVAIDPSVRRRGLARFLLTRVLEAASAGGATSATLEVRPSNEAGRALYEALGFAVEGVRPGYYQNPREDALILWKRQL